MNIHFAFFGSSRFSTIVLDELERSGLIPALVITTPDKPVGRKLVITPTVVKRWANERNIPVLDPTKLDTAFSDTLGTLVKDLEITLSVVASYGKIIPQTIIDLPPKKTLNVHPSLLPRYRGASPLQSAMLDDTKNTGITIMRIDKEMDHGPLVAREEVTVNEWPKYEDFEDMMARKGGQLLAKVIPRWIAGTIDEQSQDHSLATYSRKITKEDGLIDLTGDPYYNFRKIQAFHEWPQAYFFHKLEDKQIRVKITQASYDRGALKIERVIPENEKEMLYEIFLKKYSR